MIKIAHRGNLNGPNPLLENTPFQIEYARDQKIPCEVDVWYKKGWFLGHDAPCKKVTLGWLRNNSYSCWYHAKNLDALYKLMQDGCIQEVFWHENDDFTLTKGGYIWTLPWRAIVPKSILVVKGKPAKDYDCFGICTDFVL
jgi:hypothetical protein